MKLRNHKCSREVWIIRNIFRFHHQTLPNQLLLVTNNSNSRQEHGRLEGVPHKQGGGLQAVQVEAGKGGPLEWTRLLSKEHTVLGVSLTVLWLGGCRMAISRALVISLDGMTWHQMIKTQYRDR